MFTVRDHVGDEAALDKTFERMSEIGYTEAQTAGRESAEYAKIAKKHGITIVGTHYSYEEIINNVDATIKLHEALGTTNVGIGAMPYAARTDVEEFYRFVDNFNKASEIYAKQGYKLTYHNHAFEFVEFVPGTSRMSYMYENFDKKNVSFVLDTCWVAKAGGDVREWMEKLAGRIDILHLKDLKVVYKNDNGWDTDHRYCEIGTGNLCWQGILDTAAAIGVKNYVVEQDGAWIDGDPFKSIEVSRKYLDKFMKN